MATSPIASSDDVAARLGDAPYTGGDLARVNALLTAATDLVLAAARRSDTWLAAQTSVPAPWRWATVEAVARVVRNPAGAQVTSEALGAHSYTERYSDAAIGLALTPSEERRVRRAVTPILTSVTLQSPFQAPDV